MSVALSPHPQPVPAQDSALAVNFGAVARHIATLFPAGLQDATCIDMDAPEARGQVMAWLRSLHPEFAAFYLDGMKPEDKLDNLFTDADEGFAERDAVTDRAIFASPRHFASHLFHPRPANEIRATLWHEAAHLILSNGFPAWQQAMDNGFVEDIPRQRHESEIGPDTLTGMMGITDVFMQRPDVEESSFRRATDACLEGNVSHASTFALDTMLATMSDARIVAMKPQEKKSFAEDHARACAARAGCLGTLKRRLQLAHPRTPKSQLPFLAETQSHRQEWLHNIAAVCRNATPLSLEFHLTARVLTRILDTGRLDFPTPRAYDVSGPVYDDMRDIIATRGKAAGMREYLTPKTWGEVRNLVAVG